jgi:beta-ureidopropionase / N-carbamoyl-L-amino-acid hydrolase
MTARVEPNRELAAALFDSLEQLSRDQPGITRDAYGEGEERAHDLIRRAAVQLGLTTAIDPAGNLLLTLLGANPDLPAWVVGSHLDSVPHGGNFDGAAGVIAGLVVMAGFLKAGLRPERSVICAVFRAEESTWFPASYIGSRAALGLLPAEVLTLKRTDTGRTVDEHMRALGLDPDAVAKGACHLNKEAIYAYLEIHIEQGPVLDQAKVPVGLVTTIAGSFRYRDAVCHGTYGHSGAVPRRFRNDAVVAVAELATALDRHWAELDESGALATITMGQIATDPTQHAFSKIAGEVRFCLDVRADQTDLLDDIHRRLISLIDTIAQSRGVRFELGARTGSAPAPMDGRLRKRLAELAARDGIATLLLPSGAGHDAAIFAAAGIASAMIFIRNQNGSHNPLEAMRLDDFQQAAILLATLLTEDEG